MRTDTQQEKMLAVIINWCVFGLFGGGFVLSSFAHDNVLMGAGGFGLLLLGFICHIIINRLFKTDFASGEIILGMIAYCTALVCFVGASMFGTSISKPEFLVGILGFAAVIVAFAFYLATRYGMKNSFSMFHTNAKR